MEYRREIDGLRAVAVVPVILFHAGVRGFSGGFVGVDVFFVISGYLITSIIVQETLSGKFTIKGFYERRARRILPALFLVVVACIPFAWMWMWRSEAKEFGDSVIAVATFVSNILFWHERGYFDPVGELKPLLHTWSLAVEEQYYLLFPLFLSLLLRFGKKFTLPVILLIAAASLALASKMTISGPGAAFFLLPTRAWELMMGASIAIAVKPRKDGRRFEIPALDELVAFVGMLLIGFSVWWFDESTPFPGVWALLPTAGAGLIIIFANQTTWVGRLLGTSIPVGIGLISYSAYLWHQPMLAFARLRAVSEPPGWMIAVICAAVFPLSFLSWKFVESPFRGRRHFSRRQIFAFAAVGSLCLIALGLVTRSVPALSKQLPPNVQWEDLGSKLEATGEVCIPQPTDGFTGVDTCSFGDTASKHVAVLYGDSHARAISSELDRAFRAGHIRGVRLNARGCETVPDLFDPRAATSREIAACHQSFRNALTYMSENASDVIVASRWTFFLYPVPGEVEELSFDNHEGGSERNSFQQTVAWSDDGTLKINAQAKQAAVEHFVGELRELHKNLVIVYPVPEVGWDIAKLNWSYYQQHGGPLPEISTSYDLYKTRNRFILNILDQWAADPEIHFVRPDLIFCDTFIKGRCTAQFETTPFYYDDDHLSDAGASLVVRDIMKELRRYDESHSG